MNRCELKAMCVGLCLAVVLGGCGQRKAEEKSMPKPTGAGTPAAADQAITYRCEDPLHCIFFICDATVPGSGAPLVGFAGGASNTLLRTADGGKTWQRMRQRDPAITPFEQIRFRTALEGWAMSRDHLLFTADGGKAWKDAAKLPENFYYFGPSAVNSNRYRRAAAPRSMPPPVRGSNGPNGGRRCRATITRRFSSSMISTAGSPGITASPPARPMAEPLGARWISRATAIWSRFSS
jgi:hypothetical protein